MKYQNEISQNTVIYGGAFNPPTVAHEQILRAVADHASRTDADVWLLPSGTRRDKSIDVPDVRRLQLLQALVRDVASRTVRIAINTDELRQVQPIETIDTVRRFEQNYPHRNFTWVFGSDSYDTMDDWHEGVWMQQNLSMLVIERPGYPVAHAGNNVSRLSMPELEVSSTEVRRRMACGKDYSQLVGAAVLEVLAK